MNDHINSLAAPVVMSNTLTDEIRKFTEGAYERLPAGYINTFRNLIEQLIKEALGKTPQKLGRHFRSSS